MKKIVLKYIKKKLESLKWRLGLIINEHFSNLFYKYFFSYHFRPKYVKGISTITANRIEPDLFAIVMQGPIQKENQFTIETIKLYNQTFNGAQIILSTWEDENSKIIDEAISLGAEIILNKKPTIFGPFNINLQLVSSQNGIQLANDHGVKYIMKTRTDQRFYRHDIFNYFTNLLEAFPLKECKHQFERLITMSFGTCKYRKYGITDFMMFGDSRDMLSYWGVDLYEEGIKPIVESDSTSIPPVMGGVPIASEIYLAVKYLVHLGIKPDWTITQYWDYLRNYFCVVDGMALDVCWDKYFKLKEYRYTRDYSDTNPRAMEFADWLQLYNQKDVNWEHVRELERWGYHNGNLEIMKL